MPTYYTEMDETYERKNFLLKYSQKILQLGIGFRIHWLIF